MTNRRRQGKHRQQSQQQQPRQQQEQEHQPEEPPQQQQRHQTGTQSGESAGGVAEEVMRRLRLCNAGVLEVSSAQMYGGESDESPPTFIRISSFQKISGRKRNLLFSWAPMTQQPTTATPIESPPSLEFYSTSGKYVAQLTARPDVAGSGSECESPPPQRLEVWGAAGNGGIGCSYCLPANHGVPWAPPYGGGSFCAKDENLFAYVAEAAPPENKKENSAPLDKRLYKETWGEQLLHHAKGRIFVGSVSPSCLVSIEPKNPRASYAQAEFIPDGSALFCTEFPEEPFRLGLKFCQNRRAAVLLAMFPQGGLSGALRGLGLPPRREPHESLRAKWLSISGDDDWAAWNPRVDQTSFKGQGPLLRFQIAYLALQNKSDEIRPHCGNVRLRVADLVRDSPGASWRVASRRTVLGPRPPWGPPRPPVHSKVSNGARIPPQDCGSCCVAGPFRGAGGAPPPDDRLFGGLITLTLPNWRSKGFLLSNTFIGCRQVILAIRTDEAEGGPILRRVLLEKPQGPSVPADVKAAAAAAAVGSMTLRDTRGPWIVIQTSSPVHVPALVLAKLRTTFVVGADPEGDPVGPPLVADIVDALSLRGPHEAFDGAIKKLQLHMLTLSVYHLDYQRHWLVRLGGPPKGPENPSLAVIIHGGPHAVSPCMYNREALFLTTLGYDVLAVNYRGSVGFGQEELVSLHGNVGRNDVDDVARTVQKVIREFGYDPRRCVAVGGSHGGFLSCHLIGQYPKLFSAASTRNPVTYLPAMYATSDIPDFLFTEVCSEDFEFHKMPTPDCLVKMHQYSPTEYVQAIETPLLLALGAADLRVPASQGLFFWKLLQARGKKNRLLWYPEDNHSIDKPESDADYWANTGAWFLEYVPNGSLPPL